LASALHSAGTTWSLSSGPSFASYCAFVIAFDEVEVVSVVDVEDVDVVVVEVAGDAVDLLDDVDDFFDELPHPATARASTAATTADPDESLLTTNSPK
jgi:hypothetical protein